MSQTHFCYSAEAHQLQEGCGCRWSSCNTATDRQNCDLTAGNTHKIIGLERNYSQEKRGLRWLDWQMLRLFTSHRWAALCCATPRPVSASMAYFTNAASLEQTVTNIQKYVIVKQYDFFLLCNTKEVILNNVLVTFSIKIFIDKKKSHKVPILLNSEVF